MPPRVEEFGQSTGPEVGQVWDHPAAGRTAVLATGSSSAMTYRDLAAKRWKLSRYCSHGPRASLCDRSANGPRARREVVGRWQRAGLREAGRAVEADLCGLLQHPLPVEAPNSREGQSPQKPVVGADAGLERPRDLGQEGRPVAVVATSLQPRRRTIARRAAGGTEAPSRRLAPDCRCPAVTHRGGSETGFVTR